jgi:hypothetical protein
MMKRFSKISIIFLLIVGMFACELPDNVDPKNPREVPTETLLTNAQRYLGDYVSTQNYNIQINRFLVRYWTEVTYLTEVRYDFSDRTIPDNWWDVLYRNTLMDFEEAKKQVNSTTFPETEYPKRDNQLAIIDICQVYAWHLLVETFGNIPYSEALDPDNSSPAYDDAETIYRDLIDRLTNDISMLTEGAPSFGDADLFYEGDAGAWKKFAASLKFRMAMRLADYDPDYSQEQANAALDAGVFESQDESAIFKFTSTPPHVHSIYQWFTLDGRTDVVPTKPFVSTLDSLNDPRMDYLVDTTSGPAQPYAIPVDAYSDVAHFQSQFFEPDFQHVLSDYVEMEFLKAEAAERGGYDVSGTAEEHYNNAIEASIKYWGSTLGVDEATLETQAEDYLDQPEVDYAQAGGNWKQKIGLQKWIALYNRGCEAWSSWRVLDYPEFSFNEDMGTLYDQVPVRYPYPFSESRLNESNYQAAVDAMGGEDSPLVNLFWDVE